jgi:ubiquitin C-terminal hydrolase
MKFLLTDLKQFSDRGLTGLRNLGNTCYMNSILQCLSHTYELHEFLQKMSRGEIHMNEKIDSILLHEFEKLHTLMWSKNCTVSPAGFHSRFQSIAKVKNYDQFVGMHQNDATEFLQFALDTFHDALKRPVSIEITGTVSNEMDKIAKSSYEMIKTMYEKEYSPIIENFFNIQVTRILDMKEGRPDLSTILSIRSEPMMLINLPIPTPRFVEQNHRYRGITNPALTIYDCFDFYTLPEVMSGDNQWFNEETNKKQDVARQTSFFQFADILVIDLKRFSNHYTKNYMQVDFPMMNLDLSHYVIANNGNKFVYDLYAVCNHYGGLQGGHYTACVKVGGERWMIFNDEQIHPIPEEKVKTPAAYCLFYRRRVTS